MSESLNTGKDTLRARIAIAYRKTFGRELGPEVGHLVVAATRILLATSGLSSAFRATPGSDAVTSAQHILLGGYLLFALVILVTRVVSWEADVRLRRIVPMLDRIVCVLVVIANPSETLLYVPFLLFLFLAQTGRGIQFWPGTTYLALSLGIIFHNWIAGWWPELNRADPEMLLSQFGLALFVAVTVLGFRLAQSNRKIVNRWYGELNDVSVNARQLPIEGIAEKLATRFAVTDLILCWKSERDERARCVRARDGELLSLDLQKEVSDSLLAPDADGRTFLWDSSSGKALVENPAHGGLVLRHFAKPDVPAILLAHGDRICAIPIRSGTIAGYIYLLGIPSVSATVLARATRASEAVNATLDRYQLFDAWRDRAFAQARLALSRDMHDSVLQTLASLRMQVATIIKQGDSVSIEVRNERLSKVQSIIAAEQACLRELLVDSDQPIGEKINLVSHLTQRIELLSRQWGIPCSLDVADEAIWIGPDIAIEVEFLVREAVSNAIQHARATNITVIVAMREKSLFITLRSDGETPPLPNSGMQSQNDTIASQSLARRLEGLRGSAYADPIESGAILSMRIPVEFGADV